MRLLTTLIAVIISMLFSSCGGLSNPKAQDLVPEGITERTMHMAWVEEMDIGFQRDANLTGRCFDTGLSWQQLVAAIEEYLKPYSFSRDTEFEKQLGDIPGVNMDSYARLYTGPSRNYVVMLLNVGYIKKESNNSGIDYSGDYILVCGKNI